MKSYQKSNLKSKAQKHQKTAEAIKKSMGRKDIPAWKKKQLTEKYNKELRTADFIKKQIR